MQEEEKAQYAARQEAFFSNVKTWNEANSGKVLVFQGNPQNLIDKSVLGECDYIVIPALTATSADKMSFAVLMAAVEVQAAVLTVRSRACTADVTSVQHKAVT